MRISQVVNWQVDPISPMRKVRLVLARTWEVALGPATCGAADVSAHWDPFVPDGWPGSDEFVDLPKLRLFLQYPSDQFQDVSVRASGVYLPVGFSWRRLELESLQPEFLSGPPTGRRARYTNWKLWLRDRNSQQALIEGDWLALAWVALQYGWAQPPIPLSGTNGRAR